MKELVNKIVKLIDVKSIMTLTLTGSFVYLVGSKVIQADQFMAIFTMIVGFYFGTQSAKTNK